MTNPGTMTAVLLVLGLLLSASLRGRTSDPRDAVQAAPSAIPTMAATTGAVKPDRQGGADLERARGAAALAEQHSASSEEQIQALQALVTAARRANASQETARALRRIISLTERAYGTGDRRLVSPLSQLSALSVRALADYKTAEETALQELHIVRSLPDADANTQLTALLDLAYVYSCTAHFAQATPLFDEATALVERSAVEPELEARLWLHRADMSWKQFDHRKEEECTRRALAVLKKVAGGTLQRTEALVRLGGSLQAQGRMTEARQVLQQAVQIQNGLQSGADAVCAYTSLLVRIDERDEAERLLAKTIAEAQSWPTDVMHARLQEALSSVYMSASEPARAEPGLREALAIRRRLQGDSHVDVATTMTYLGDALLAQERYDEAQALYEEAVSVSSRGVDPNHPHVSQALECLGRLHMRRGNFPKARDYLLRTAEIVRTRIGGHAELLAQIYIELSDVYDAMGDKANAQAARRQATALRPSP